MQGSDNNRRALAFMVARACMMAGALALSGCVAGPDYAPPRMDLTHALPPDAAEQGDVPGEWWHLFGSPALDDLVAEALRANPDAAAARAALRQADELVAVADAGHSPNASLSASDIRQRISGANLGRPGMDQTFSVTSASLNVAYAPDVFGAVARNVENARAQRDVQAAQVQATYLALTGNVVTNAIAIAQADAQIAATQDQIAALVQQGRIAQAQVAHGAALPNIVTALDATIAQTRAALPPLVRQREEARLRLAALTGRLPGEALNVDVALARLTVPRAVPPALPSALLAQRPDIRAAQASLHAANAAIGMATAAQLPQITLNGAMGTSAATLASAFSPTSLVWSLGGSAAQSLFDGGALRHRKQAAIAARDAAEARWKATVLGGFGDVARALHALTTDADAVTAAQAAHDAAAASAQLVARQIAHGAADPATLPAAQAALANATGALARAQAARLSDTAALYVALGGGWWNRQETNPPPAPDRRFTWPPFNETHR